MRKLFLMFVFVLALGWITGPSGAKAPALPNLFGGSFDMVDETGKKVTDQDFKGSYMLIAFGYTFCPDICPTMLSTFSETMDILGEKGEKLAPIFVSIDPERDRPEVLADYVSHFHPKIKGLTGSEKQVAQMAKVYRVHRHKVPQTDRAEDLYLVNHSANVYLMGPDGKFLTLFPHGTNAQVMAERVQKYIN